MVVLVVIYLLCLVYCTASVFTMQALTYNSMGWGAILAEYKLDFAEDSIELNYYDFDGTLSTHLESAFTPAQQAKVRLSCAISLMPLWRSAYDNPFVMDGDQWRTITVYNSGEKITYGSNSYPITYHFVYHTIMSVFDSVK